MVYSAVMLGLVMVVGGVLLCAGAAGLMAWSLVHPPRMGDGKAMWVLKRLSPADLGLEFEDVKFVVRDERGKRFSVAAWWIPNPRAEGRCVVLQHGYADAKVGAIAWAPVWHSLGFNVLTPDMRAHGESGGTVCTAGYFEREDLSQVIDELRATKSEQTRTLVLAGMSMGGAVAAAAAARREDVAAVVLDSVYARFRNAAMRHMSWVGLPGGWVQGLAIKLAGWMTGAEFEAMNPVEMIGGMKCPVMVIEAGKDWSLSDEDRRTLKSAVDKHRERDGVSRMWTVEDAGHLMALVADAGAYREQVSEFLSVALEGSVTGAAESDGGRGPAEDLGRSARARSA